MKLKLFISYSRADGEDFAQHLYNHLVEKNMMSFLIPLLLMLVPNGDQKLNLILIAVISLF